MCSSPPVLLTACHLICTASPLTRKYTHTNIFTFFPCLTTTGMIEVLKLRANYTPAHSPQASEAAGAAAAAAAAHQAYIMYHSPHKTLNTSTRFCPASPAAVADAAWTNKGLTRASIGDLQQQALLLGSPSSYQALSTPPSVHELPRYPAPRASHHQSPGAAASKLDTPQAGVDLAPALKTLLGTPDHARWGASTVESAVGWGELRGLLLQVADQLCGPGGSGRCV